MKTKWGPFQLISFEDLFRSTSHFSLHSNSSIPAFSHNELSREFRKVFMRAPHIVSFSIYS